MIFIFAAHYGEVENIIRNKKMGKRKISFPFCSTVQTDGMSQEQRKNRSKPEKSVPV